MWLVAGFIIIGSNFSLDLLLLLFFNQIRFNRDIHIHIQKSGITGMALMFVSSTDKSEWFAMFRLWYSGYVFLW